MSKKGLIHISDRTNQWRYVDKDGFEQWVHPVSAYKASEDILYGQAVSAVTLEDNVTSAEDPEPYVRKTDTSRDVKAIGLALETVSAGETVHILPFGMFTYDSSYNGLDGIEEYNPGFTYESVGKKVYVKSGEPGCLTVSEDEILTDYNHIICVGYLTDAPAEDGQTITAIEISISGDERGPVDHTQFEAVLGEDVEINENDPIRLFAMGQEKDENFKFKLVLTPQDHNYTNHDFIAIQRYDGKTVFLYPGDSLDLEGLEDNSDLAFVKMSKIYNGNESFETKKINLDDSSVPGTVGENLQVLKTEIAAAFSSVSDGFESNIDTWFNTESPFGYLNFESAEAGGYFTIYISAGLYNSFEQTTIYNHGSYHNLGTVVLADARIGTRRNVIGIYYGKKFGTLEKGTKTLFMRLGEYTLSPETLSDTTTYKSTTDNNKEGTVYYLGNNGQITDRPYSQIDFVSRVATLKTHSKLIVDIGHSSKYYSGSFPVGYMKPCIDAEGRRFVEYGFILMDGTSEYPCTAGSPYYQLYCRLQGQFDEQELHSDREGYFKIPRVTRQGQPMQIKYLSEGVYEDLTRTAFIRKTGRFEVEGADEIIQPTLPKFDITPLVDFGITDSGYEKPEIDNLDIHLYVDPNKNYESGPHDWREIPAGFFNFNNYGTYGFNWVIEEDLNAATDNNTPYGRYNVTVNVGDGRGIAYVNGDNQAPMKVDGCCYKVYIARKELYPRQFDLNGVFRAYINNSVYDENGLPCTDKAVSGKAVLDAIASKVDITELVATEGAIIKLGDKDENVTTRLIHLIADEDMPIFSKNGTITIGNDETKQCLKIENGKIYKTNVTGLDKIYNTTTVPIDNEGTQETVYVVDGSEVPTVKQVREHAELTLNPEDDYMKSYANRSVKEGKIHGMIFGHNGNIDASKLSGIRLMIDSGAVFTPDSIIGNDSNIVYAYIPLKYWNNGRYETHDEGVTVHLDSEHSELAKTSYARDTISTDDGNIIDIVETNNIEPSAKRYVEKIGYGERRFETTYDLFDRNISFYWDNRKAETPSFATLTAAGFVTGSWSKYKKIFGERILDNSLISTALTEGSIQYTADTNPYKDVTSALGSALQAAYELPLAYWLGNNEKNWYNKSLGIVVERVRDVAENISTDVERTIYSETGDNSIPNSHLTYNYTENEINSIKNYYATLTDNYGQDITSTVGLLLAAAKETQERLLKTEVSIFGADYETIPGERPDFSIDIKGVTQMPTTFGLNRLIRAICAELYGSTNPENNSLTIQLDSEANRITSVSRIDDIEKAIKGKRNSETDPEDFNVTSDNSLEDLTSTTYPYNPNPIYSVNPSIDEEETIQSGVGVDTLEKLNGENVSNDPTHFNGTIDAIYRIVKKLNALTEEINGTDNINQGPRRFVRAEETLRELIEETYFNSGDTTNLTESPIPADGISRFDKLTEALYKYNLLSIDYPYEDEIPSLINQFNVSTGRQLRVTRQGEIAESVIPTTLNNYETFANKLDIIIDALGSQWYRKAFYETTDPVSQRRTKTISDRIELIERQIDLLSSNLLVTMKDENNVSYPDVFEYINSGNIVNSLEGHRVDEILSRLSYLLVGNENNMNLSFGGVDYSLESSIENGKNLLKGINNLLARVKNLENYQAMIKFTIGNNGNDSIYGNNFRVATEEELELEDDEFDTDMGIYNPEFDTTTGIYQYENVNPNGIRLISKDLEALKYSLWGSDEGFRETDGIRDFENNNTLYKLIKDVLSPIQQIQENGFGSGYYLFDSVRNRDLFINSEDDLRQLPSILDSKEGNNRFDVLEREIIHIREFLGLESKNNSTTNANELRYKYNLKPTIHNWDTEDVAGNIDSLKLGFEGYNIGNSELPSGEPNDNQYGLFEDDSILNELLFNINSVRLLRANVGSNEELYNRELDLKLNLDDLGQPIEMGKDKDGSINLISFENAFLNSVKLTIKEGNATSNITQRINNISDYLVELGNYITDKKTYIDGLQYIGRQTENERISAATQSRFNVGNSQISCEVHYYRGNNGTARLATLDKPDNTSSPYTSPEEAMGVLSKFEKYVLSNGDNNGFNLTDYVVREIVMTDPVTNIPIDDGEGNHFMQTVIEPSGEVVSPIYIVTNEVDNTNRYKVYIKDSDGIAFFGYADSYENYNINITDNQGSSVSANAISLQYDNVEQDESLVFNGKHYNLQPNKYHNLLSEIRIHNLLLRDIINYIDKDTSTGNDSHPTTDSLI